MFKIETHMHTAEGSACATLPAKKQIMQYKKAGYDGVIVTDHFVNGNSAVDRSLSWELQMDQQFKGYELASKKGQKIGIKVYQGIEFAFHGTEFLVIGLGKEWFIEHEELKMAPPEVFLDKFLEAGAAVIQAHPFREAPYISKIRLYPENVDAIEVFNHRNQVSWNEKALALAKGYNLPMTAGSDCHHKGECHSGIIVDRVIETTEDLIKLIKSGQGFTPFEEISQLN